MREPLVSEASTITVPSDMPDMTALRIGKLRREGGAWGQNWDATAPFVPIPSAYLLGGAFQITLRGGSMLVIQR